MRVYLQLLILDKSRYKAESTAAAADKGDSISVHSSSSSSSPNADSSYGQAARSAAYSSDDIEAGALVSTDTTAAAAPTDNSSGRSSSSGRRTSVHGSSIDRDEALLSEEKSRASRAVGIVRLLRLTQVCVVYSYCNQWHFLLFKLLSSADTCCSYCL
jgi:hypothetical protein